MKYGMGSVFTRTHAVFVCASSTICSETETCPGTTDYRKKFCSSTGVSNRSHFSIPSCINTR